MKKKMDAREKLGTVDEKVLAHAKGGSGLISWNWDGDPEPVDPNNPDGNG